MKKLNLKAYLAEVLGTFTLVFVGTGTAILTGNALFTGLAFALSVVMMAYSIGSISGAHLNPAVSLGFALSKKLSWKDFGFYALAQVIGAFIASALLGVFTGSFANLAGNTVQPALSDPNLVWGLLVEVIITALFIFVILGVTSKSENNLVAGFVIGLTLGVLILVSFNLSSAGLNPARSIAPAVLQGGTALEQLWIYIVGPFVGSALGALLHLALFKSAKAK